MKRFLLILAAAAALVACGNAPKVSDPLQDALEAKIKALTSEDAKVTFFKFEKVDSTTFAQELAHRRGQFELRLSQNEKFYGEYKAKGMQNNMDKKAKAIANDKRVLEGLSTIEESLEGRMDDVAYYDFCFSGKAESKDGQTDFTDYYASITPEGEVLSVEPSTKGLHKSLGRVLPGYTELVKGSDGEE